MTKKEELSREPMWWIACYCVSSSQADIASNVVVLAVKMAFVSSGFFFCEVFAGLCFHGSAVEWYLA